MVFAICETKEDADSQILFWRQLNNVMQEQGYPRANFSSFMGDEEVTNILKETFALTRDARTLTRLLVSLGCTRFPHEQTI